MAFSVFTARGVRGETGPLGPETPEPTPALGRVCRASLPIAWRAQPRAAFRLRSRGPQAEEQLKEYENHTRTKARPRPTRSAFCRRARSLSGQSGIAAASGGQQHSDRFGVPKQAFCAGCEYSARNLKIQKFTAPTRTSSVCSVVQVSLMPADAQPAARATC